jgi:hypothetical protein
MKRIATALLLAVTLAAMPLPATAAPGCSQGADVHIWTAPRRPQAGEPLEILAVATDGALDDIIVTDPAGAPVPVRTTRNGGPPWGAAATLARSRAGTYRVEARRGRTLAACREVTIGAESPGPTGWDLATEALYAVWIERLFDAPPSESLNFPSLEPVLRDPSRNFLHSYLGAGEDSRLPATPDCADLPYFLRAYFSWKVGLPFAYRPCGRGSAKAPPNCGAPVIETAFVGTQAPAASFRQASRRLMDTVHSGSARTSLRDEGTDLYPVPLQRDSLWPGTVYADPYGHVLVLVKWIPQTSGSPGMLLAVDAQPDNSVSRKRFWEGTFLFADTPSAGPGFKTFRPLTGGKGSRVASNSALSGASGLPPFSTEQAGLTQDDFYARVQRLINPRGLAPDAAYEATLAALVEQVETRVTAVDTGEAHQRKGGATIPMPSGPAIFETTGPWEDYSTPSRDMRLLIAMKVLEGLPQRIRRYPDLFVLGGEDPGRAAARIEALHARRTQEVGFSYHRSDGSPWPLRLKDLYERRAALELAYNPNDCPERRWGAKTGTPEAATCRRQAPADQRAKMEEYRAWFRDTRRPPR